MMPTLSPTQANSGNLTLNRYTLAGNVANTSGDGAE